MFCRKLFSIGLIGLAFFCAFAHPAFSDPLEVSGKVFTSDGKPAVDASIHFLSLADNGNRPYAQAFARSQAGGSYYIFVPENEIKKSRNNNHTNVIVATYGSESSIVDLNDPKFKEKEIHLLPSTSVSFHVVDENDKPVEGVAVTIDYIHPSETSRGIEWGSGAGEPWKAFTDKQGNAVMQSLPVGSSVKFIIDSAQYESMNDTQLFNVSKNLDVQSFRVATPGSISGKATYSDTGNPAANVYISAFKDNGAKRYGVRTDENGNYTLPKLAPGVYSLQLNLNFATLEQWTALPKSGVEVQAKKSVTNTDFSLISGAVLTGKITDKKTGTPITKYRVQVIGEDVPYDEVVQPHNDGTYKIHVPPGNMIVRGYNPFNPNRNQPSGTEMHLSDGETKTLDFDVASPPSAHPVHGIVVDSNGAPVANAKLWYFSKNSNSAITQTADAQGIFKFDSVYAGDLLGGFSNRLQTATSISMPDSDSEIKLVLDSPLCYAVGNVVDQDGKPLAGANIELWAQPKNPGPGVGELLSAKGTTDLKGHYSLGPVFSGLSYGVNTRLSGYSSPGYTIIEAVKGESLSIPSIKLAKMDGIISGLVMDEDGKPMANVKVASGFGADENAVYSDSKGRFTLKHFPRGKSRVWAQKEGYSEEGNDDIQSGDTDVEITMVKNQPQSAPPAGDAVVSGRVVDNDGKPVGGAVILLREVNKATNAQYYLQLSNTDDNGKFEKDNVPADFDYTVASIFNINGYYIDAPDNIKAHKAGENASTDIIVYKLDSSISGKVIDSVGKPASGVSIYVEGSIDNRANLTGKDGSFNVHAPAGKKVTLLTREASGECAQTQTIGGSKDVLIQLLMPKHHGDGTPAKKLLITTLAQAKIVHKGVLINFYQSMEPSTTTSCLFDKDLRQILSKYFVILDIDTWESHDAWINSGWQQLRDPLTHKRIDSSWLFSASGKLLSAEIPHSYNPATNNVDAKAILETLKNAAPQITDSDAKIIADRINEMIEAAKKKI